MSRSRQTIDAVFASLPSAWGGIDFLVHAIAFSDKDQLDGRYVDTTADNFTKTHADQLLFVHRNRAARRKDDAEWRLAA